MQRRERFVVVLLHGRKQLLKKRRHAEMAVLVGGLGKLLFDVSHVIHTRLQFGELADAFRGLASEATFELFRSLFLYAAEHDVKHYVIVTTVAAERLLRSMKLKTRRFGDGRATELGRVNSVALWLNVDRVTNARCSRRCS